MHQTILLVSGYLILQWQIPDSAKWLCITLSSFAIILVLYEFVIRRFNGLRILFGLKLKKSS